MDHSLLAAALPGWPAHPIVIAAVVIGFYMAWNIGANDVANAMGTSVGSKALTFRQAVVVAAIFEFAGAVLVGSSVTDTVRQGIINPNDFAATPDVLMYGMLSALLAAAIWLNVATYFGQPVSTTHSIVGGVFGFGLVAGASSISWSTMGRIVASWFISPVASGLLGMLVFWLILKLIIRAKDPDLNAARYAPFFVFVVVFVLVLSVIYKGLKSVEFFREMQLGVALGWAAGIAVVGSIFSWFVIARIAREMAITEDAKFTFTERIFASLQILTACYVAFAHGANDVANAVGPLAAVYHIHTQGTVEMSVGVPIWILAFGGLGIVAGLIMMGWRVMRTIGTKITEITPSRGFAAQFAGATAVLVCSRMGMPVSTTHCLVGGVMGVALVRGVTAVDAKTVSNIFVSWIITVPIAAVLTIVIYGGFWLFVIR
ncbi:MAG: inorganic phosphate transporter [Candidatus Nealsonbacteria bacterium]|nr:inorganic phosphate transporter [Candidatus Nealsonbacteria bacterium]